MLENTMTRENMLTMTRTTDAVDSTKEYAEKAVKIAQLISEDFFGHHQAQQTKIGFFDTDTMMGISKDLSGNAILFDILFDYLLKISKSTKEVSALIDTVRKSNTEQEEATL